jgi:hypothetical protein
MPCCVKTVTQPSVIHVVPDVPSQATFTMTLAGLLIFYRAGWEDALAATGR